MHRTSFVNRLGIVACIVLISSSAWAQSWKEFLVSGMAYSEYTPCVSGNTVVWEAWNSSFGDWDVYGADISDPNNPEVFVVSAGGGNENYPVVSNGRVVWQNKQFGAHDGDIIGTDLGRPQQAEFIVTVTYDSDLYPAISGPNVVWQHWSEHGGDAEIGWATINAAGRAVHHPFLGTLDNDQDPAISENRVVWKQVSLQSDEVILAGADISDPDNVRAFDTGLEIGLNQLPKLDGDWVVAIDRSENGTLWANNLADSLDPLRITDSDGKQINRPDIAGSIVVWQDDRNGDWDIYGFDLTTLTEFPITTQNGDQKNPSIYTDPDETYYVVVWQDERAGDKPDIYGAIIKRKVEPTEPGCTSPPPWDINGDCLIDFLDFAILADHWLERVE